MVIVGRHINGIFLNPLEYLLSESGDIVEFENKEAAEQRLLELGADEADLYNFVFCEVDDGI
ncbi:MAG TPA: hypothetical protein PLA54_11250 [Spirochaetota bacterium]|nr:hypothetical protein [Spirochaetota bacterium]